MYLKKEKNTGISKSSLCYKFDLSAEIAVKLAEKLGCLRDNSTLIPENLPVFIKLETYQETIMIETGFGVSFTEENAADVDKALTDLGFDLYNQDREWN